MDLETAVSSQYSQTEMCACFVLYRFVNLKYGNMEISLIRLTGNVCCEERQQSPHKNVHNNGICGKKRTPGQFDPL